MVKFIPYERRSKEEKSKMDLINRQAWGKLTPVTRKPKSSKAYGKRKAQDWKREVPPSQPCAFSFFT